MQSNNIIWEFQASFFLAALLPLLAFYLLGLAAHSQSYSAFLFFCACLVGLASAGMMANGVLALPLMTVLALFLKIERNKIITLGVLSGGILFCYFYTYFAPSHHGSLKDALLHHPFNLLRCLLLYLGSPFYYMTGKGSRLLASLGGMIFIGSCCFFIYDIFKKRTQESITPVLLIFLLYIGLTACGTAGGWSSFGLTQALTSRYTTPVLMGWAALIILYALKNKGQLFDRRNSLLLWALVPLLLLPEQLKVLRPTLPPHLFKNKLKITGNNHLYEREIAALALELGAQDSKQITLIFPHVDISLSVVAQAKENNLSIFGYPLIKNKRKLIGHPSSLPAAPLALGNIDSVQSIQGETRYIKIQGWLWDEKTNSSPKMLYIIDQQNQIVGYAFTGDLRPDLKSVSQEAKRAGFKYLLAQNVGGNVTLRGFSRTVRSQLAPLLSCIKLIHLMNKQKILLPGSAGLVGQNLIVHLKRRGYKNLVVLDKHAANLNILRQLHPDVLAEQVDLAEPGPLQQHVKDADIVVMLQAQIGGNDVENFARNNIESTSVILETLKDAPQAHLIHISSSVVETEANDFYTSTKKEQERLVLESGLLCPILRPTLMFGWFDRKHLGWLSRFMQKVPVFHIPGQGRYLRQPLYEADFCKIIISCIEGRVQSGIYNISGHEKIDYIDIIRTIKRVTQACSILLKTPYRLFYALLWLWELFDKNPPFTTQQLAALVARDEFEVIDWPTIFSVPYTPFSQAMEETFNDPIYSKIVLEF